MEMLLPLQGFYILMKKSLTIRLWDCPKNQLYNASVEKLSYLGAFQRGER
jgi:hypothetical protein